MQRTRPEVPVGLVLRVLLSVPLLLAVGCGGSGGGPGARNPGGGGSSPAGDAVAPGVPIAQEEEDKKLYLSQILTAMAES
jgi:hypothetical protein